MKTLIKLMKINHYIKNTICFVPLIFSLKFTETPSVISALLIFAAFCLVSSSVYIMNDIFDVKADKMHRDKRLRPIANNEISTRPAFIFMLALLVLSIIVSLQVNILSACIIFVYFILNIFYSVYLKHFEIIDAASIAIGFILRILAGCAAILVPPSALVILLTFFVSIMFTFSKRKLEIKLSNDVCRKSAKKLTPALIEQFILISAVLSVSFYSTYVTNVQTIERTGAHYLYISTIPFALIIFRLLFLVNSEERTEDITGIIYEDRMFKILFLIYFVTLMVSFIL